MTYEIGSFSAAVFDTIAHFPTATFGVRSAFRLDGPPTEAPSKPAPDIEVAPNVVPQTAPVTEPKKCPGGHPGTECPIEE